MNKYQSILEDYEKAVISLEDVLKQEKNEYMRDSAIQRFEFTFELAWKTLKIYLENELNIRCNSPKACFREAYAKNLIDYDEEWLNIANMRNETTHIYDVLMAENIYKKLPATLNLFKNLLEILEK